MLTKLKLQLLLCCFIFLTVKICAQPFAKSTLPEVYVNTVKLKNPWAGGLNSTIFNTIDLNGDGIKDLFLFDKQYNSVYPGVWKMRTFINKGTAQTVDYVYEPQYESCFPQNMTGWCVLVDFNCDGYEDIFTYNAAAQGIRVYKNNSPALPLSFSLQYSSLTSCYISPTPLPCGILNFQALFQNIPAFTDVNNDGDMDILTFQGNGNAVEYHENLGIELFGKCDTIILEQLTKNFAHFTLNSNSNTATLGVLRMASNSIGGKTDDGLHAGSCMIAYDEGGDGDKDLINGDVLGRNLLYLNNEATLPGINDSVTSQDTTFPAYNVPVDYVTFPSPFLFDADNDGIKDLVVSSCVENQSENFNNNYYYKNVGDNINHLFQYVKNQFLTDEMIDVGSGAFPVFHDVDGDGKKDLVVGNHAYFISNQGTPHNESAVAYFRNTTTGSCPSFELVTPDFANLQQYNLEGLIPTFGDLDGDGDSDMLVGNSDGTLYYFTNTGGNYSLGAGGINFQGIDVGTNSAPQLVDMDIDGLIDIIIGEKFGKIQYFHNTGTSTNPLFGSPVTTFLGGINVTNTSGTIVGHAIPCLFIEGGQQKLLVGSESGYCFLYDNITGNLGGNFNLVSATAYSIFEPYQSAPALADLNNDGSPEIIVGCYAGGLGFYSNSLPGCATGINEIPVSRFAFSVYPNPAKEKLIIDFENAIDSEKIIELYDMPGKLISTHTTKKQKEIMDVSYVKHGIYFIKIISENTITSQKIIIE